MRLRGVQVNSRQSQRGDPLRRPLVRASCDDATGTEQSCRAPVQRPGMPGQHRIACRCCPRQKFAGLVQLAADLLKRVLEIPVGGGRLRAAFDSM